MASNAQSKSELIAKIGIKLGKIMKKPEMSNKFTKRLAVIWKFPKIEWLNIRDTTSRFIKPTMVANQIIIRTMERDRAITCMNNAYGGAVQAWRQKMPSPSPLTSAPCKLLL